jgi:Transposase IS116/IS110/IS902 family
VIGAVRDVSRFPDRDHFAAYNGTAPIEVSSGHRKNYWPSRRGNRRLNHVIHMAAVTQIRYRHSDGHAYYDKKIAEGKTPQRSPPRPQTIVRGSVSSALVPCSSGRKGAWVATPDTVFVLVRIRMPSRGRECGQAGAAPAALVIAGVAGSVVAARAGPGGTRGLLALRSSSGLGVPTSCKRAGEEAAATGGGAAHGLRRGSPLRLCGLAPPRGSHWWSQAGRGPAGGYAAIAAVWLMVPAAILRSQALRLVMTL